MSSTLQNNKYVLAPFQVVTYVDDLENRVEDGFRLSLVRWKAPTEKELKKNPTATKRANVCVMLPSIALTIAPMELQAAMQEALEELQDRAVRGYVEEKLLATPGINLASLRIPEELGTPAGLRSFHSKVATSGRLSGDSLGKWFDATMSEGLVDLISEKLASRDDIEEDAKAGVAVGQVAKAKEAIVALASPRSVMPKEIASQLARAIGATVPEGDRIGGQLLKKLDLFINPPSTVDLLLSI